MKNETSREIIRYGHNFKQTSHHTGARKNQNQNSGAIVCTNPKDGWLEPKIKYR